MKRSLSLPTSSLTLSLHSRRGRFEIDGFELPYAMVLCGLDKSAHVMVPRGQPAENSASTFTVKLIRNLRFHPPRGDLVMKPKFPYL